MGGTGRFFQALFPFCRQYQIYCFCTPHVRGGFCQGALPSLSLLSLFLSRSIYLSKCFIPMCCMAIAWGSCFPQLVCGRGSLLDGNRCEALAATCCCMSERT